MAAGPGRWPTSRGLPAGQAADTLLATNGRVVFLAVGRDINLHPFDLSVSADSGRTWRTQSNPCPTSYRGNEQLQFGEQPAVDPSGGLWLICNSEPGTSSAIKVLVRSDDLGAHWTPPVELNYGGYVAALLPWGAVAWKPDAVIDTQRTTDGGRTWSDVEPQHTTTPDEGFAARDPEHAYLLTYRFQPHRRVSGNGPLYLVRTSDGGRHWTWHRLPPVPAT